MEVQLTRDQKAFSLWEKRERMRAEIFTAVDEGEASLVRGEGRTITQESMHELAESVDAPALPPNKIRPLMEIVRGRRDIIALGVAPFSILGSLTLPRSVSAGCRNERRF
jgi:hypothetical protein